MNHVRAWMFASLLFLQGCGLSSNPMFDQSAFNTAVAKTVAVGLTQSYASPTLTMTPSQTFTVTPTVPTPTETPTLEATATLPFPATETDTPTPAIPPPLLSVSVNTNCRSGAGLEFPVEGSLLKGEATTIHGVDPSGKYWYIANPDPGDKYCWISGKYASIEGAISLVPVLTPPATPTVTPTATPAAEFRAAYSNLDGCGDWRVELVLTNQGGVVFRSIKITVRDSYWGQTVSDSGNAFVNFNKCERAESREVFEPQTEVLVTAPGLTRQPKNLEITIMLCTEAGLGGQCQTRVIKNVKP